MSAVPIFVTGGTGYLGRRLIPRLLERGHPVRALVRPGSEKRLSPGAVPVLGNALDGASFAHEVRPEDTFVQLVGVPHPSPAKAEQFRAVDLVSVRESVAAAGRARVRHFVYVSVAQPAPIMKAYQEVRAEGERLLRETGLPVSILRPWYVLGPGHQWARALKPLYWMWERIPSTRETALRLGLVTLEQMTAALVEAIEHPPDGIRIADVVDVRKAGLPR